VTKREIAQESRAERREERARYRRCFWAWPFGHLWGADTRTRSKSGWRCANPECGKTASIVWKGRV
jgi:hypothetical protein